MCFFMIFYFSYYFKAVLNYMYTILNLSNTLLDASAADDFWQHYGKSRNCSWWVVYPFATVFSTCFAGLTLPVFKVLHIFAHMFSFFWCKLVVCWKRLIISICLKTFSSLQTCLYKLVNNCQTVNFILKKSR